MAKKQTYQPTIPPLAIIIVAVVVVAAISLNRTLGKINVPNPTPYANDNQWQKVVNQKALFYTKIFQQRDKTFISIPIKFEQAPQTMWLTLQSTASAGIYTYLVVHPQLDQLQWNEISDGPFHLYQKSPTYKTIGEFLNNPPPESKLMIDTITKNQPQFKKLKFRPLTDTFDANSVDFVLTTYIKSRETDNIRYYENTIDATNGRINQNGNLAWELLVPTAASASPYYLGNIHVDYRK